MSELSENDIFNEGSGRSLKDYFNLIRNNYLPIIIIILSCLIISIIYAVKSKDIFRSVTSLKIEKPKTNVLGNSLMPDFQGIADDRFISTEIEIMKSRSVREKVAEALLDSVEVLGSPDNFYVATNHSYTKESEQVHLLKPDEITGVIGSYVQIGQKNGMNIVDISVETPSVFGSAMLANIYANEYRLFNLEVNRNQLTSVREFLSDQAKQKQQELQQSESALSQYQAKNGIIALDAQSQSLITQLATFEAQRDGAKIDLSATEKMLAQLKEELKQQDPKLGAYIESLSAQSYIQGLQDQIAKLQINKDMVSSNIGDNNSQLIKQYDSQITELKKNLSEKTNTIKKGLFASNPDAIKDLTGKILDAEVKEIGLKNQLNQLNELVKRYELQFNKLPATAIGYAELDRKRDAAEKLYSLLEEKYQEALITEQSEPGSVFIIDNAVKETIPAKPNRVMIVLIGFILGIVFGVGFVVVKDFFDNTIKSPDDLEKKNINLLAWVPVMEGTGQTGEKPNEFIVAERPDAIVSEAFKALRTRIQFSKIGEDSLKTILVTSPAPGEGKTFVSINLAGVFAQAEKKTLLIDTDLRKPRIHSVFKQMRTPGLIDYFFGKASLEEIVHSTQLPNLSFISTGTIPPNPSEMLGSKKMKEFLQDMRKKYDIIILDSAPIIAVTDSEILARLVDATILVASAETTEMDLLVKATELLKNENSSFIGTVLNKFSFKAGYGSYYKYYYYYSDKRRRDKKSLS
jgi:tyrosine-protein kinase Etk/Wzc